MTKDIYFLGYLSDIAGAHTGSAKGPFAFKNSPYLTQLISQGLQLHWENFFEIAPSGSNKLTAVAKICKELSQSTYRLAQENKFFIVLGGDHTSAIGTWSGVASALAKDDALGLIWIDAHMDSHTPQTSETGNIHGMPLACLLGKGATELTHIGSDKAKLKPENLCLIGVRSFEQGEAELLRQLNVKIFFMDEIKQKGLHQVMQEAILHVTAYAAQFGVSLDIDSIDPLDAPGTGIVEPDGLSGKELVTALSLLANHPKFIGAEIVEFDPNRDKNQITEKLMVDLVQSISKD